MTLVYLKKNKYFFIVYICIALQIAVLGLILPIKVHAGECSGIELLKDGKVVSKDGKASVPAKEKGSFQIKVSVSKAQLALCKETHLRVGLIFINQSNSSSPVKYVVEGTKIPESGFSKTISFAATGEQGIYNYSLDRYKAVTSDINKADGSIILEGLRVTLGKAGSADTGNTKPSDKSQLLQAREYAGKNWEGTLKIKNDTGVTDIVGLGTKIINWLLLILSLVATVMVIYAGVLLVFNAGNEAQVKKAKTTLIWAIIGLVISLSAFAIVNIVQSLLV